jgi:hypothetical protein
MEIQQRSVSPSTELTVCRRRQQRPATQRVVDSKGKFCCLGIRVPELLAGVVMSKHTGLAKECVDTFRVRSRCVCGVAVISNPLLFRQRCLHCPIPQDRPVVAFQADEMTREVIETAAVFPGNQMSRVAGQIDVIAVESFANETLGGRSCLRPKKQLVIQTRRVLSRGGERRFAYSTAPGLVDRRGES